MSTPRIRPTTLVPPAPARRDAFGYGLESASWTIPSIWKRYTLVQHAYLRTLGLPREQPKPVLEE